MINYSTHDAQKKERKKLEIPKVKHISRDIYNKNSGKGTYKTN